MLEEERKEQRQAILERLQPGLIIEGQISNIVDFGAFVDLDGIDGLIHISELSWSHVNHPSEILNIGDTVQVKVLDIDRDRQRISLGLKQTQEDPWQRVVDTYSVGDELEGTVTKVVAFGAFVEILEGVEGLVHISELAQQHVENPREIVQPGDEAKVKILEIDSERRRLSLSIKRVEDQILPRRDLQPAARASADAGDLDNVPELGLSEDVFATPPEPVAREDAGVAEAPTPRTLRSSRRRRRRRSRGARGRRSAAEAPRGRSARGAVEDAPAAEEAPAEEAARGGARRGRPRRGRGAGVAAPPFVGLTGGIGAGKSEALAALARLGAATLSTDAVVHELYADPEVRDAVVARWGADVAPGGVRRPRRGRAARVRRAERARVARGAALAARRRARRRLARGRGGPRRRRRARSSSRRRCCSRRGWSGSTTLPWWSSPTRRCARERAAARGHAAVDERTARQLSQDEKAARARPRRPQRPGSRGARAGTRRGP